MSQIMTNISIIIPAYNSEKYIIQCLQSLLIQNLSPLEIICINDASTDKTLSILNEYANKYNNIKIFNNAQNSGPAYCRNLGLKHASGEYIWFIDSDDWISPLALTTLESLLHQTKADIIGFRAQTYNNKTHKPHLDSLRDLSLMPDSFFYRNFDFSQGKNFLFLLPLELWSRIFKRHFLQKNDISFDEDIWGLDDGVFLTQCFIVAEHIFYSKEILYTYRRNTPQSIIARLGKPDVEICKVPILYAKKCDRVLEKYQLPLKDCEDLISRNIDRIIDMFPKLKSSLKPRFFNEIKAYLIRSNIRALPFIKHSPSHSLLKEIETLSYKKYFLKNLIFQVFESNTRKRIMIFQMPIYKTEKTHNVIKNRSALSIFKVITYLREEYNEMHYFLFGIAVYKRRQLI